jgi:hypothetical protein
LSEAPMSSTIPAKNMVLLPRRVASGALIIMMRPMSSSVGVGASVVVSVVAVAIAVAVA